MGTVITFPAERPGRGMSLAPRGEDATVVILPVIRIERHDDNPSGGLEPDTGSTTRRRRRKR